MHKTLRALTKSRKTITKGKFLAAQVVSVKGGEKDVLVLNFILFAKIILNGV